MYGARVSIYLAFLYSQFVGSDGHKSCYTNDLLRQATYPFLERSIVRQGLQRFVDIA